LEIIKLIELIEIERNQTDKITKKKQNLRNFFQGEDENVQQIKRKIVNLGRGLNYYNRTSKK
jgi:hypothetical protein